MRSEASSPDQYISELPAERRPAIERLRKVINENIPPGFEEVMSYGMIGFVVPHEIYPDGYHCSPELPLPFINLASQKNYIALYHSGIYADPKLLEWFKAEYTKIVPAKIDMGKSCVRFRRLDHIPYDLVGELCGKMTVDDWITLYESRIKK